MDPITKLKNLEERARQRLQERQGQASKTQETPQKALVLPFPAQWNEESRATPDICLRSALFGVVQRGKRRYLEKELLAAQNGYEVHYTGQRLDQNDLDVWQQVLHLCREQPAGEQVYFSLKGFLRAIGRHDGKSQREWLKRSLNRLVACAVTLKHDKRFYSDNLLGWGMDEENGEMYIRVNRQIVPFFERDQYTLIDFQRRLSLGSQLARWLHDFYSTHARPFAMKVATLRDLCGSEAQHLNDFRPKLKTALNELVKANLLTDWKITTADLVKVGKHPSTSQGRYLIHRKKLPEPEK